MTTIEYDAIGDKIKLVDPTMGTFGCKSRSGQQPDQAISHTGTFTFEYNAADSQPVKKRLPDGQEVRFTYGSADVNGISRVTHIDDSAGTVDFRYDPRGNVAEKRRDVDHRSYLTAFSRDSMGRMRRVTYPDGFEVDYKYNAAAQVDTIEDGEGRAIVSRLEYNASGDHQGPVRQRRHEPLHVRHRRPHEDGGHRQRTGRCPPEAHHAVRHRPQCHGRRGSSPQLTEPILHVRRNQPAHGRHRGVRQRALSVRRDR